MANNSIFARSKHRANLQRNAFDLSQSSKFTASVGMLLPCFCLDVNPNEHFRINPSLFLRTVPMNSAAFVRLKQYCEFYFVPYRLLWRSFPQFIAGTSNQFSKVISNGAGFTSTPYLKYSDIITGVHDYPNTDSCGYKFRYGATRLLDLLGYGINSQNLDALYTANKTKAFTNQVNPFRMLAYQKIYSDYYRNPDYEAINVSSFNCDDWKADNTLAINTLYALMPRYRDWKKDYFNSISPSFQGSNFMSAQFDPIVFPVDSRYPALKPDTDKQNQSFQGQMYAPTVSSGTNFTIANLRSAYALDKLYRSMISAKDGSYSEQMKVRFGVDASDDDWKSTFIGAIDAPITIGDVETTADTYNGDTGSAAGTIYGKGTSLVNGNIEFTTKEHGIIMGIFSILPECDYSSDQIDPFVTKFARSDYFQPEFMDLGKQPLPVSQYKIQASTDFTKVLGYQLRYSEYKTNVDKVHGVFNTNLGVSQTNQSYNAWVAPRNTALAQYSNGATVSFFKCLPSVLDSVMVQAFDGTEQTDQFLVNANFNCQAIRPMSIYGEPSLN